MILDASDYEKCDLLAPQDILGGGSYRWSGERLDRDLVRYIIDLEIGGTLIKAGRSLPVSAANDNIPARRKRAA
jgi:hypothetical protein